MEQRVFCMPFKSCISGRIGQNGLHCCILQVLYEARGPSGAGFIAAALTDNLNRCDAAFDKMIGAGLPWTMKITCASRVCICYSVILQDSGRNPDSRAEGRRQNG